MLDIALYTTDIMLLSLCVECQTKDIRSVLHSVVQPGRLTKAQSYLQQQQLPGGIAPLGSRDKHTYAYTSLLKHFADTC